MLKYFCLLKNKILQTIVKLRLLILLLKNSLISKKNNLNASYLKYCCVKISTDSKISPYLSWM